MPATKKAMRITAQLKPAAAHAVATTTAAVAPLADKARRFRATSAIAMAATKPAVARTSAREKSSA